MYAGDPKEDSRRLAREFGVADCVADAAEWKGKNLIGSIGGTVGDIEALYALMADGALRPEYEEIGFAEIPDGLKRLAAGEVTGRLVARFGET